MIQKNRLRETIMERFRVKTIMGSWGGVCKNTDVVRVVKCFTLNDVQHWVFIQKKMSPVFSSSLTSKY